MNKKKLSKKAKAKRAIMAKSYASTSIIIYKTQPNWKMKGSKKTIKKPAMISDLYIHKISAPSKSKAIKIVNEDGHWILNKGKYPSEKSVRRTTDPVIFNDSNYDKMIDEAFVDIKKSSDRMGMKIGLVARKNGKPKVMWKKLKN